MDSAEPAAAADIVQVFATGLGATQPAAVSGQGAPATAPLAQVRTAVTATVSGQPANVIFAGLAPRFVDLYQVAVR